MAWKRWKPSLDCRRTVYLDCLQILGFWRVFLLSVIVPQLARYLLVSMCYDLDWVRGLERIWRKAAHARPWGRPNQDTSKTLRERPLWTRLGFLCKWIPNPLANLRLWQFLRVKPSHQYPISICTRSPNGRKMGRTLSRAKCRSMHRAWQPLSHLTYSPSLSRVHDNALIVAQAQAARTRTIWPAGFFTSLLMLSLAFPLLSKELVWLDSYPLQKIQKQ